MKNVQKQKVATGVCDLSSRHMLMAGDDPVEYEAFRDALLVDLLPMTSYERVVANDLVALEWESRRMRAWVVALHKREAANRLVRAEMRDPLLASSIDLSKGSPSEDWIYGTLEESKKAEAMLRDYIPDLMAIVADGWSEGTHAIHTLQAMIELNQGRRNRLLSDYRSLQSQRRSFVTDAELVED